MFLKHPGTTRYEDIRARRGKHHRIPWHHAHHGSGDMESSLGVLAESIRATPQSIPDDPRVVDGGARASCSGGGLNHRFHKLHDHGNRGPRLVGDAQFAPRSHLQPASLRVGDFKAKPHHGRIRQGQERIAFLHVLPLQNRSIQKNPGLRGHQIQEEFSIGAGPSFGLWPAMNREPRIASTLGAGISWSRSPSLQIQATARPTRAEERQEGLAVGHFRPHRFHPPPIHPSHGRRGKHPFAGVHGLEGSRHLQAPLQGPYLDRSRSNRSDGQRIGRHHHQPTELLRHSFRAHHVEIHLAEGAFSGPIGCDPGMHGIPINPRFECCRGRRRLGSTKQRRTNECRREQSPSHEGDPNNRTRSAQGGEWIHSKRVLWRTR